MKVIPGLLKKPSYQQYEYRISNKEFRMSKGTHGRRHWNF